MDKIIYTPIAQSRQSQSCLVEKDVDPKLAENFGMILESSSNDDFLLRSAATNQNLVFNLNHEVPDRINTLNDDNGNKNSTTCIDWDDMLDSEFLLDSNANVGFSKLNEVNEKINKIFPNENTVVTKAVEKSIAIKSNANKRNNTKSSDHNPNKTRSKKRKAATETTVINNNLLQGKVTSDKPKNILRKQCYTKTVENWLEDVESLNSIEECVTDAGINNDSSKKVAGKINNVDQHEDKAERKKGVSLVKHKNIVDKTQKVAKKVIQAQLANKNGVMKFSKPKNGNENNGDATEKKHDNVKGKAARKFVPPIKSQIPVKDVTYNMCVVNEMNIETYEVSLGGTDNEVLAVLLYRYDKYIPILGVFFLYVGVMFVKK